MIKMNELFKNIHPSKQGILLKMLEANTLQFNVNELILSKIKIDDFIAIINEGEANLIKTDSNGNKLIVEELTEGKLFGTNISNLNNKDYEIESKTDVTITFIEMHFILNPKNTTSQIYSQFLINLLELLNKKYTETSQRLDILTNKTIRNKLLEYFKNSYAETNARVLYLKSSFTALADYLAVDRSAMTRELKNLKDEGLIEIKNKKIKLLYFPLD